MNTEYKARDWDRLLRALGDSQLFFSLASIQESIEGHYSQQEIKAIIEDIEKSDYSNVIGIGKTKPYSACATVNTSEFLDKGGFMAIYHQNLEMSNVKRNKLIDDAKKSRKDIRFWWLPYLISGFSLVVAVLAYFRPPDNGSTDKLDNRIEQLEHNQEQIEKGLEKQNDSLQNELYEAQMLIESYES